MEHAVIVLLGMAIVAKYGELLKSKTTSLDDKITVEESIDLLGEAVAEFVKDLDMKSNTKEKPKGEA